jgi:hypothetical protein
VPGRWVSKAAVAWVLYEAEDVPAHLLATLLAVAASTSEDGTGAWISAGTVAQLTRKTERNAKRDLAALRKLGLIMPGNQRLVAHIRADRRPFVYDLPMPRGGAHVTPSTGYGVAYTPARGGAESPNGVAHTSPKESLKNSGRRARDSARAQSPPRPPPVNQLCRRCGRTGHARQDCTA